MKLRLYHYWRSSSSWRIRWALELKRLECELVAVNLLDGEQGSAEHRARNPYGSVPVLEFPEHRAGSKETPHRYLGESMAILHWLESVQPSPALLPSPPLERARVIQLAELINAGIQPIQNLKVLQRVSSDPDARKAWAKEWIQNGLAAYEALVSESAGKFSYGDQVTWADLFLIPQIYNADRYEVSLESFPTIARIHQTASQTPECLASAPDQYQPS